MTAPTLTLAAFAALYAQCAPPNAPPVEEMAGIAMQESGLRPWAMRDETTRESLFLASREEAERIAGERLKRGHVIGAGLFQITHARNWKQHRLTINNAFDPCTNLRAGINHYAENLKDAARQLYNSGKIDGAPSYARSVRLNVLKASSITSSAEAAAPTDECAGKPPKWDAWANASHQAWCRYQKTTLANME